MNQQWPRPDNANVGRRMVRPASAVGEARSYHSKQGVRKTAGKQGGEVLFGEEALWAVSQSRPLAHGRVGRDARIAVPHVRRDWGF